VARSITSVANCPKISPVEASGSAFRYSDTARRGIPRARRAMKSLSGRISARVSGVNQSRYSSVLLPMSSGVSMVGRTS
jgi:hypothetical protein